MSLADCRVHGQRHPFPHMEMQLDPRPSGPLNTRYHHDMHARMHRQGNCQQPHGDSDSEVCLSHLNVNQGNSFPR